MVAEIGDGQNEVGGAEPLRTGEQCYPLACCGGSLQCNVVGCWKGKADGAGMGSTEVVAQGWSCAALHPWHTPGTHCLAIPPNQSLAFEVQYWEVSKISWIFWVSDLQVTFIFNRGSWQKPSLRRTKCRNSDFKLSHLVLVTVSPLQQCVILNSSYRK